MSQDKIRDIQQLPMVSPPDPEVMKREREWLASLENESFVTRNLAFLKQAGPGYLQSAMTLGGGTAAASLFAGAAFGYQLLWVAPVSMLLGVIMLAAVSHQTLSTGLRPFHAMKKYAGGFFAYGWAFGGLLSSIIWQFAQYALAAAVLADLCSAVGLTDNAPYWATGLVTLVIAIAMGMMYGRSVNLVRRFEQLLRYIVWFIILCFALVVIKTGIKDFGGLVSGFLIPKIPDNLNPDTDKEVITLIVVIGSLAASVGVNMVFLYPYTLLARGWGREHRRLARFDLGIGMFIPYVVAVTLMTMATANTFFYVPEMVFEGTRLAPVEAARVLSDHIGPFGRIVFDLGVFSMALSSIVLQMLCSGFACSEMFDWKVGGPRYRLASLVPAVGFFGALFWSDISVWIAVPTSIICGFLLPIAYVGFIRLHMNRKYLGDDTPSGGKGTAWVLAMVVATLVLVTALGVSFWTRGLPYIQGLFG